MAREMTAGRVEARLARALDRAADRAAVVERYAARWPHLEAAIRAFAGLDERARAALAPPPRVLVAGDRLGGFEVVRAVGPGGMGEVYEARDDRLNRTVALKVVRRGRSDPAARGRFEREQRALAQLHHTHIVPIHAAGEAGDIQFFAMAFLRGASLARVVDAAYDLAVAGRPVPDLPTLAGHAPAEPPARPRHPTIRLRPGPDYYRSVAAALATASEAVEHAHAVGVCHKDLKPSNLMVDPAGHVWVIDFGLADILANPERERGGEDTRSLTDAVRPDHQEADAPRAPGSVEGTPPYMAPEQFAGRHGPAADVWGLGVTLYELLSLRRAFDGPDRVADPRPVRELVRGCPRDLVAICTKAMRPDPADRYGSPAAFAADLRRWLGREPTAVRPGWPVRPVVLWAARNRRLAAAVACAVLTGAGLAWNANERRKDQEVGRLLLEATNIRMAAGRVDGWSAEAWKKVKQAAELRPGLAAVRDEAAATLVGLDAERVIGWNEPTQAEAGWRRVAFSADGRRVVSGGTGGRPTWLFDRTTGEERTLTPPGGGPVGFMGGVAVQVLLPTPGRPIVLVWDLDANKLLREFPVQPAQAGMPVPPNHPTSQAGMPMALGILVVHAFLRVWTAVEWVSASLTPDVKLLVAAHSSGFVAVWDLTTGALVRRIDGPAAGVAVSADGARVAVGGPTGEVTVWPLPGGEPLPAVRVGRTPVRGVAFGAGLVGGPAWRLAAGDDGGTVCTWDEARPGSVVRFLGSYHEVMAVAFSPDGMTLASAGRYRCRLWDVATGRLLLDHAPPRSDVWRDVSTGLAFAPDGAALAVGSVYAQKGSCGGADVWRLDNGRGVRSLRGLAAEVSWVWPSADGSRLAALSHDWRVAVWDLPAGRLIARFDMPPGWSADSAGLAFGPGDRLAFSAGREAGEWDLRTGRRLRRWVLPKGLHDQLAYHPDGGLYLFRKEYDGDPDAAVTPQLGVLRDLRPGSWLGPVLPPRLVLRTDAFRNRLRMVQVSSNGRYFVAYGEWADTGPTVAVAYDAATGQVLWSDEFPRVTNVAPDPAGGGVFAPGKTPGHFRVIELPGGRDAGEIRRPPNASLGPGGRLSLGYRSSPWPTFSVYRGDEPEPCVSLPLLVRVTSWGSPFTPDERYLFWGNQDGTVSVWDPSETARRLTGLGPGW